MAYARKFTKNGNVKLFIQSLPDEVEMPFQYSVSEIETFPEEVKILSLQLKENLSTLQNLACKVLDVDRKEYLKSEILGQD